MGLDAPRLLDRGAPEKVIYSLLLYERGRDRNHLRLQADNFDGPFDVNEGTKLDLDSTAQLRPLVSYLQIIATLYEVLRDQPQAALQATAAGGDALPRWFAGALPVAGNLDLTAPLVTQTPRLFSAHP